MNDENFDVVSFNHDGLKNWIVEQIGWIFGVTTNALLAYFFFCKLK